jgi:hypothetical protein
MAKRKVSTFERLRSGKMNRKERKEWQQRLYAEDAGLEVIHPRQESMWVMRVILSPCRRIVMSNQCGSSDRGRRIYDEWRNG